MINSDSYCLNSKLVVSELAGSGFVVYVPPNPVPHRLRRELWLALQAWVNETKSLDEWEKYLSASFSIDAQDNGLQDLLEKNILTKVHIRGDQRSVQPAELEGSKERVHRQSSQLGHADDDVGESASINLIKWNPHWPDPLRHFLLSILRLQVKILPLIFLIIFGYSIFLVFTPVFGSFGSYASISEINYDFDVLVSVLIGLLGVNLFSTLTTWLAQTLTRTGDGQIVLRFLFGFIPRFGVNPYTGAALKARQWTAESNNALLCIAQPLFARLSISATLILLLASGRLQAGLAGSQMYSLANIVLQISLISFLILALPFRMSPGYRLMILLTNLPPSTLGRSVSQLYLVFMLFFRWVKSRDPESERAIRSSLSSKRNIGLVLFALVFIGLIATKLLIIVFFVIPRLATGLPSIFGGASQYIFTFVLFALLWRFLRISIAPKIITISRNNSLRALRQTEDPQYSFASDESSKSSDSSNKLSRNKILLLFAIVILIVPVDQTITGSVVVSNERDLTVRAPDDVRLVALFQQGPSSQIIAADTPLAELQSVQLERDLFQINSDLVELEKSLDGLKGDFNSLQRMLLEVKNSLVSFKSARKILNTQLSDIQKLADIGAVSKQSVQELLLQVYELQEEERAKVQQQLELEADLQDTRIKIQAIELSLDQSLEWQRALLRQKKALMIIMPFDGLITSTTSGLRGSFFAKGETLLELREGSLQVVNVLVPDHDRALIKLNQSATVRLYANPNQSLSAHVQSIRPSSELIDQKAYFQVSLRLKEPLSPNLLQSSGAARIKSGSSNLLMLMLTSIGRFVRVDVWSWTP